MTDVVLLNDNELTRAPQKQRHRENQEHAHRRTATTALGAKSHCNAPSGVLDLWQCHIPQRWTDDGHFLVARLRPKIDELLLEVGRLGGLADSLIVGSGIPFYGSNKCHRYRNTILRLLVSHQDKENSSGRDGGLPSTQARD